MDGQGKAAAWCGRLLLFAALLVGIVTMHTLGHPSGHAAGDAMEHDPRPAVAGHQRPGAPTSMESVLTADALTADASATAPTAFAQPHACRHGDGAGLDPASVCLAVLSFWSLALLTVVRLLARRRSTTDRLPLRALLLRVLWPIPPPGRRRVLAQLSVLRI